MTKIIRAKYKVSRKLRSAVWDTPKDPYKKRNYGPGQHGSAKHAKSSDYGIHLKAKQLLRAHYGWISEKQFSNTFAKAAKMKGNTAINFVCLLERRLSTIVYRLNFAPTVFAARQLVSHKHIAVNGRTINIGSYLVKAGDVVSVRESSKEIPLITQSVAKVLRPVPDYLSLEPTALKGTLVKLPEDISSIPYPFVPDVNMVVEYYSR